MQQKESSRLRLKRGKEKNVLHRHHWIYSGAVEEMPEALVAEVASSSGEVLGVAFLGQKGRSIAAHMVAFGSESLEDAIAKRIQSAIALRRQLFEPSVTNAYRLIHAEGDGLPGLIVDSYDGSLVLQISHPAWEEKKEFLLEQLIQQASPRAIFEKSTSFLRKKEGMKEVRECLYGDRISQVTILENGLQFHVDLLEGQKTGLFLDQREMRSLVRSLSNTRRVLNCFSYTGGFSVAALAGNAASVESVEISGKCEKEGEKNISLNHLPSNRHQFRCEDAIDFVAKKPLPYDLVILDPPAFVKKKEDIGVAFRAYKELNRLAIQKMPAGSLLLTCSCSYHVSEELFQNILFRASLEAGREVRILENHRQAHDHPVSIFHPEGRYLKSCLLSII